MAAKLAEHFLARLSVESLPSAPPQAQLQKALRDILASAEAAWPTVVFDPRVFINHLAAVMTPGQDVLLQLSERNTDDLFLACACAAQIPEALRAFELSSLQDIDAALGRSRLPADDRAEIRQQLMVDLLVPRVGKSALIGQYAGRGSLRAWLRVIAVRAHTKMQAKTKGMVAMEEEELSDLIGAQSDAELTYLKETYRAAFKEVFTLAIASLSMHDRLLLKQYYLDGLTIDELGRLHDAHRATAARWIAAIRATLLDATKQEMAMRFDMAAADIDSVMRLIRSRLDASIRRALLVPPHS